MDIPPLAPWVRTPFLVTIGITLVNAVVSLAFSIQAAVTDQADTLLLYGTGRSLVFLFLAIAVGVARAPWGAVLVAGALAVVQAFDTIVGAIAGDPVKTWGPLVPALITGLAAVWLASRLRRGSPDAPAKE